MKIVYQSIQRVVGLIGLPYDTEFELLDPHTTKARAFLTMKRDPYFLHLRRCSAYGKMLVQTLTTGSNSKLPAPDRFAAILANLAIDEGMQWDRPLLVLEATNTIETQQLAPLNDFGACCFGMRLFEQSDLAKVAMVALESAVSSIALILPRDATPTVQLVGNFAYAIENETNRCIYSLEPSGSASMTSMTSIGTAQLDEAPRLAQRLFTNPALQAVAHLLARSLQTADNLQAFLTAWAALEVFLDKIFDVYKLKAFAQMKSGMVSAARPFVDRLRSVIETDGRYNVRDKFVVVSSFLNDADAEADCRLFQTLKKTRDSIHVMKLRPSEYPTSDAQNLLRKYLKLYLASSS